MIRRATVVPVLAIPAALARGQMPFGDIHETFLRDTNGFGGGGCDAESRKPPICTSMYHHTQIQFREHLSISDPASMLA